MKVMNCWLVETAVERETSRRLINSIKKRGGEVHEVEILPFKDNFPLLPFKGNFPFFYGSISSSKYLYKTRHARVFYDDRKYKCSYYYPKFGKFLWNEESIFMPYGMINSRRDFLFKTMGVGNCIFLRPDSPDKEFTGTVIDKNRWEEDFALTGFYVEDPDDLMCVVAQPMTCIDEVRLIIGGGNIITGSYYMKDRKSFQEVIDVWEDTESTQFASKVLHHVDYAPDPIWVLDVCKGSSGKWYVLECGPFSASGLYQCDTDKIIEYILDTKI